MSDLVVSRSKAEIPPTGVQRSASMQKEHLVDLEDSCRHPRRGRQAASEAGGQPGRHRRAVRRHLGGPVGYRWSASCYESLAGLLIGAAAGAGAGACPARSPIRHRRRLHQAMGDRSAPIRRRCSCCCEGDAGQGAARPEPLRRPVLKTSLSNEQEQGLRDATAEARRSRLYDHCRIEPAQPSGEPPLRAGRCAPVAGPGTACVDRDPVGD